MASTSIWIDDIYELDDATAWNIIFSHGSLSMLPSRSHPVLVIRPAALTALCFSHIGNDVTLPGLYLFSLHEKLGSRGYVGCFVLRGCFCQEQAFTPATVFELGLSTMSAFRIARLLLEGFARRSATPEETGFVYEMDTRQYSRRHANNWNRRALRWNLSRETQGYDGIRLGVGNGL